MILITAITLAVLLHHPAPTVVCQTGAVSYKFVGAPGTQFTYSGKTYAVPPRGWIELIGHGPPPRSSRTAASFLSTSGRSTNSALARFRFPISATK